MLSLLGGRFSLNESIRLSIHLLRIHWVICKKPVQVITEKKLLKSQTYHLSYRNLISQNFLLSVSSVIRYLEKIIAGASSNHCLFDRFRFPSPRMLGLLWQWAYGCWTNDIPMSMQRRFSRCSSWLSQEMAHRGKRHYVGRLLDCLRSIRWYFWAKGRNLEDARASGEKKRRGGPPPRVFPSRALKRLTKK